MRTAFPRAGLLAILLPPLVFLTACGSGPASDAGSAFSVTDSAGVEVAVTTFSEPVPTPGWTIDEASQVRYGESSARPVNFVWVRNATRLPDGRVVALDPQLTELFVFAPTGELITRAGREGDGPGEFKRPSGLEVVGGDTIVVYDASHMRLSLFDMDGGFLEERRLEQPGSGDDAPRLMLYEMVDAVGDTITLRGTGFSFRTGDSAGYTWENPTLRYTVEGSFLGDVAEPTKLWFVASNRGPRTELFGGNQGVTAAAGRVYVGDRGRYEVRVYDPPRGLVRIERLVRPRRPVTDEMIDDYKRYISENVGDENDRKRFLENVDEAPRADSVTWIGSLTVDALGNVWVSEFGLPGRDPPGVGVFSHRGEWLGTVRVPQGFRPLEIGEDYILGTFTDELDVPHLVSYDLVREPLAMETAADQAEPMSAGRVDHRLTAPTAGRTAASTSAGPSRRRRDAR